MTVQYYAQQSTEVAQAFINAVELCIVAENLDTGKIVDRDKVELDSQMEIAVSTPNAK